MTDYYNKNLGCPCDGRVCYVASLLTCDLFTMLAHDGTLTFVRLLCKPTSETFQKVKRNMMCLRKRAAMYTGGPIYRGKVFRCKTIHLLQTMPMPMPMSVVIIFVRAAIIVDGDVLQRISHLVVKIGWHQV